MNNLPPINKSYEVIEKGTTYIGGKFLRWIQSLEQRVVKSLYPNEKGNISYNNEPIPSDLSESFYFDIHPNNLFVMRSKTTGQAIYSLANAYFNSSNEWFQPNAFAPSTLSLINSGTPTQCVEMRVAESGQPGGVIAWQPVLRFGTDGVLHLKSGSSIVYDL
ncbi:MAG: hypothetical protein R3243_15965 [Arenibacter latericius]|nr:hypothetical protein [Arenibacter latericius]